MALEDWSVVSETPVSFTPTAPVSDAWEVASETPVAQAGIASLSPAQQGKQGSQFFSELGRGAVRAAKVDLPSLYEQAGVIKDIGALTTVQQRLNLFDRIEKGEIASLDQLRGLDSNTSQARAYFASSPEVRQKIRERAFGEIANRKDFVNAAIKTVEEYQKEAQQYAPLVEKASKIRSLPDFANWLGSNIGSGAVQMAPLLLAAAATGGVGLVGLSSAMGVGESVGDRLKFLGESTKGMAPEQRADAIIKYLQDTGDVTLTTGIVSGLLDASLGPEAAMVKKAAANLVKATSRKEAVKQAAKEVPKKIAEEAFTGGAQQAVQTAGAVKVKEKPEFWTVENVIDILDAAAAEGAGALAGASIPVATAALKKPAPEAPAPERIEPTWDIASEAPAPAPKPAPAPAAPAPAPASDALLAALGIPPAAAPVGAPERITPGAAAPLSPEEIEAKVADYSKFMPEEDARRLVAEEQQKAAEGAEAEAAAPAAPAPAPATLDATTQRLKDLTQERIDAGVPPQQAALQALEQLQQEQRADEEAAKAAAEGEKRATEPLTPPSGAGTGVASVSGERPAAEGVAGTERTGVVPTEADVGQPAVGEGAKPGAVGVKAQSGQFDVSDAITSEGPQAETVKLVVRPDGTAFVQRGDEVIDVTNMARAGFTSERIIAQTLGNDTTGKNVTPVKTSTTATEAATAAPAPAPAAPKGKRGRKALPPEQKTQSDERRKEQRREANAAAREVERLKAELAAAKETLEPGNYPNEAEYSEAKISQGMRRKRALAALYDFSRTNRNKPGQEAKAALEAEATKQEIDDIAKGQAVRKQAARKISPSQKDESRAAEAVNPKLKGVTTGLQAIGVLLRTGTVFQKLMAMRIRNSVRNVKVVVLEKDDPVPAELLTDAVLPYWESARALYVHDDATGADFVYVRGESFGVDQGLNNVTVLHELLHAATAQKLQLALRLMKKGLDSGAPVVKAAREIQDTMHAVADDFVRQNRAGTLPRSVAELFLRTGGAVIADVKEFVAYGLSDPAFQRYLNSVTNVAEPTETFFSRFVDGIRALFGIPEDMHTAMTNLVNATDKLISSPKTERMRLLEEKDKKLAQVLGEKQRVSPQAKDKRTLDEIDKEVDEALIKFVKSKTAEEAAENASFLHSLRRWDDFKRYFNSLYQSVDAERLELLLAPAPTDVVASWGSSYIPELSNTNNLLIDMRAMQHQMVEGAAEVSDSMVRAIKKDPSLFDKLAKVMSVATDTRVDPAVDSRNTKLSDLYNDLGTDGQRVYKEVRDYYARIVELYMSILDAQIQDANLPPEAKNAIMAQIRKKFEADKKIVPYFPFTRNRGPYSLRVKVGSKPIEFYMLGSIAERDAVAAEIAKQEGKTVEDMFSGPDPEFVAHDTIADLRKSKGAARLTDKIKDLFEAIDNMSSLGPAEKDNIKDSIYELHLITMPEQSFRGSFIERKDVIGYSTDVVRAFSTSSLKFASQLPRLKYSQKLRNSILAGRKSLEGNKEASKLERFVREMEGRVDEELNPVPTTSRLETAAGVATRVSFIHLMTSPASALVQATGLLFGASTLGARHGYAETALEMGKMMRLFGEFSIIKRNSDGSVSVTPPTAATSKRVQASPMERRAVREVFGLVTGYTISSEVLGRGRVSTAEFEGRGSQLGRIANVLIGGLFHTTERLVREAIFMSSFRLSLKEGQKKGLKGDELYEFAKRQAIKDVYDSVGNLSEQNRAPMFRGAAGKVLLQFLHQPIFITLRWMQEFGRMLPFMGNKAKFQAFKEFAGIMGTAYLLGGVVALPFLKEMVGFIGAAFNDWDDKDKPDEMKNLDYWTWWANVWLPKQLGKVGIYGKSLEELTGMSPNKLAAVVTRGPTNVLTGVDISSRVSINPTDMIFGQGKEVRTTREGAIQTATEHAGPAANMILSYMDAYDAWQMGDSQKAMEKLLPAAVRNVVIAEKYSEEGVKDYKGRPLIGKDSYTKGDYLFQAIGFRPDDLANQQKILFALAKGENALRFERERIIRSARDATLKNDTERLKKITTKQNEFSRRYPEYEVTQEDIDRSVDMSIEELAESFKGFRITDKNERIFGPTAVSAGRALVESRAKKTEKKGE